MSVRTISDLERGIHVRPRRSTLEALARAFELEAPAAARISALERGTGVGRGLPRQLWPRIDELPLVARDEPLQRVRRLWQRVRAGGRSAVAFVGEPGVGKSRLLAEIAAEVVGDDAVVLAGRCDDPTLPYGGIADALRRCFAADAMHELLNDMRPAASHLALVLPELASQFEPPPSHDDRASGRARLHDAIDDLLAVIAAGAPVVVVIDDLHNADPSTLAVLRHLVHSSRPGPLLLLGAYRSTETTTNLALTDFYEDLSRARAIERVDLTGLDRSALQTLAELRTGTRLPDAALDAFWRLTGGNPFYVEEMLTSASEHDVALDEVLDVVPPKLRDVVLARARRLTRGSRRALEAAALLGSTFDPSVITHVIGARARSALDEAAMCGFIDRRAGEFAFRHDLVRAALLDELGAHEIARLHWRVGEALEGMRAAALDAAVCEIAYHLQRGAAAGDAAKAIVYLERAGALQFRSLALDEAAASIGGALELLPSDAGSNPRRIRLLELLAEIHFWRNDPDAMRAAALGAAELARACGFGDDLARASVLAARWSRGGELDARLLDLLDDALAGLDADDFAARSQVIAMRAYTLQASGRGFATRPIGEEAERMARASGDSEALALTLLVRTYTEAGTFAVGRIRQIADDLERTAARIRREDHREQYHSFAVGARLQAQLAEGDRAGFARSRRELDAIANRRRAPFLRSQLLFLEAALLLAEGRIDAAMARSSEAVETWSARPDVLRVHAVQNAAAALERGDEHVLAAVETFATGNVTSLGYAARALVAAGLAARGDHTEARRLLDDLAADGFSNLCEDHLLPQALRWLCEATALLGTDRSAAALLPRAEPYGGLLLVGPAATTIECAADRAIAQLLTTMGRFDEAVHAYERAAAFEAALGFTALELTTNRWLVAALRARAQSGDYERASALAHDVTARAERLGLRAVADACEASRPR